MEQIIIEKLQPGEVLEASVVIIRACVTCPVPVAVLQGQGEKQRRRLEAMFRIMLGRMPGQVLLAKDQGHIIGVMRLVEWPRCQMSPLQGLRLLPAMLKVLGGTLPRMLNYLSIWAKHDPKQPHWHFGPLGVLPERQGPGIGSHLLECFGQHVDSLGAAAYLETGKLENVRLYERFGFSVTGEAPVYGVPTRFMWRPVRGEAL